MHSSKSSAPIPNLLSVNDIPGKVVNADAGNLKYSFQYKRILSRAKIYCHSFRFKDTRSLKESRIYNS